MENRTILIADDDSGLLAALKVRCEAMGVSVLTATNGAEVLMILRERTPDLLILDINMPGLDGLSVGETLMQNNTLPVMPMIFFSGLSDPAAVRRCEEMGAYFVFKDSDTWSRLQPLIAKLLQRQIPVARPQPKAEPPKCQPPRAAARDELAAPDVDIAAILSQEDNAPRVLVIDDDLDFLKVVTLRLEAAGLAVFSATGGTQGFALAQKTLPDVIVTDYAMPHGDGESLLIELKGDPLTKNIPVIVMTGRTAGGKRTKSLNKIATGYGADGFFTKPIDFDRFLVEIQRLVPSRGANS